MKFKKKIDDLYRDGLNKVQTPPPPDSWEVISSRLPEKSRKKIIPLWIKWSGVAAVFALISMALNFQFMSTPNNPVVKKQEKFEEDISPASGITPPADVRFGGTEPLEQKDRSNLSKNSAREKFATKATSAEDRTAQKRNSQQGLSSSEVAREAVYAVTSNETGNKKLKDKVPAASKENTAASASTTTLAEANQTPEMDQNLGPQKGNLKKELIPAESSVSAAEPKTPPVRNENYLKRFQISTKAGAVYFRVENGNPLDEQFAGNGGDSDISIAYGVNLAYKLSERVKIRSGVSKVNLNYNTRQVNYSAVMNSGVVKTDPAGMTLLSAPGDLDQTFAFIEVPVEVEFAILNKKIGLSVIGGASTLFLNENRLSMVTPSFTTDLGEGQNLNDLSFSANLGLGMFYEVAPQVRLNVEPMIKYQVNAFEHDPGLRSYYFGIFSGITYLF